MECVSGGLCEIRVWDGPQNGCQGCVVGTLQRHFTAGRGTFGNEEGVFPIQSTVVESDTKIDTWVLNDARLVELS